MTTEAVVVFTLMGSAEQQAATTEGRFSGLKAAEISASLLKVMFVCISLAIRGFIYPGVPVLDEPKICQEFTLLNGTPVRTRYFDNDCLVPVVHNIGLREEQMGKQ